MSPASRRGHSCVAASPFAQRTSPRAQPCWKRRRFIGDPCSAPGSWQRLGALGPHAGQAPGSAPRFPRKPLSPGLINHHQTTYMAAAGTAASPSPLRGRAPSWLLWGCPGVRAQRPGGAAAEMQPLERGLDRRGGLEQRDLDRRGLSWRRDLNRRGGLDRSRVPTGEGSRWSLTGTSLFVSLGKALRAMAAHGPKDEF